VKEWTRGVSLSLAAVGFASLSIAVNQPRVSAKVSNGLGLEAVYENKAGAGFSKEREGKEEVIIHPRIKCPLGFWQSNSTTVPFCVNQSHETYKDTPVCLLTDTCKFVTFQDIRLPLMYNSQKVIDNWQHYANAVSVGKIDARYFSGAIGVAWPGLSGVQTSWGKLARLVCDYGNCHETIVSIPILEKLMGVLSWGGLASIESTPQFVDIQNSSQPLNLGKVPAKWLGNVKIYDIVDNFDLWEHTIDSAGVSQPTAGQAGMEYKQFVIVQAAKEMNSHGVINFTYDDRLPSDLVSQPWRRNQTIISGTNRFVKTKCTFKQIANGFTNCANLQLRLNRPSGGPYQLYLMVSGLQEQLLGKAGGDWIAANTLLQNPYKIESGDFRGPEVVGSTNDEPLLPQGSNVTVGLNLDQCSKSYKYQRAHYASQGDLARIKSKGEISGPEYVSKYAQTVVPAYTQDPCPNIFRKAKHKKKIITMDAKYQYIHEIPRVCHQRQLYRLALGRVRVRWGKTSHQSNLPFATDLKTIYACESIKEVKGQGKKYLSLSREPIPIPMRGGLISVEGDTAPSDS